MISPRGHRQEFTTSFSRLHSIRNWILHMWRSGPVAQLPRNILSTTSPTSYYFLRDPNLLTPLSISDHLITQVRAAAIPLLSQSPDYSPFKTESWNRSNLDMKSVQTSPTQYSTPCYLESQWRFSAQQGFNLQSTSRNCLWKLSTMHCSASCILSELTHFRHFPEAIQARMALIILNKQLRVQNWAHWTAWEVTRFTLSSADWIYLPFSLTDDCTYDL